MAFRKTAKIPLVALAEGSYDSANGSLAFKRVASNRQASVYDSGARIDVGAALKLVSKEYNISDNPKDYVFEAARAVTAEVPNENGDAFPRNELLRFDHRLGKAIYQTFIFKPHHINHRADNPKTARGVVLDASYNDLSEPLPECPGCGNKTASVQGRDGSGVNCIKCGHVVKDEFVELLLAIDTQKDPTFAEGVRKGSLDSLSMGCEAGYTDCSICANRARSVSQFCAHIKSGKKKIFKTAAGPKMSFEKCGDVVFTEISRVDQPADPKAKQREVFQIASPQQTQNTFHTASSLSRALHNGATILQAQMDAQTDLLGKIEELKATHPELYTELKQLLSPEDEGVPAFDSFDDYAKEREKDVDQQITPAEMGIKPEDGGLPTTIASKVASDLNAELDGLLNAINKVSEEKTVSSTHKFAAAYKDLEAFVTKKGNVRVSSPRGTLFVIRPENKPTDTASAEKVATEIMSSIAADGLVLTATKYNAVMGTHVASILQHHMEDFDGGREEGDKGPITDGGEDKMNALPREKPAKNLQDDAEFDHAEGQAKPKKEMTKDVLRDHKAPNKAPDSVVEAQAESVQDKEREKAPKTTLDDIMTDRADKKAEKTAGGLNELRYMKRDKPKTAPDAKPADAAEKKDDKKEETAKAAQMAAPMPPAAPAPGGGMASPGGMPAMAAPMCECDGGMGCKCPPGCNCKMNEKCGCPCSGKMAVPLMAEKEEEGKEKLPFEADLDPAVKQAAKKYTSRAERLYKAQSDKVRKDAADKIMSAEKTAADKVQARLLRALRLAAKRQALNLEESPLKAKMFDVLATEVELDSDSYYPGMDAGTAAHLIEATVSGAMEDFIEGLVKRATEFLGMNEEAFTSIEADVKNLQPAAVAVSVQASRPAARADVRRAAVSGNLVVAPSAETETVSSVGARGNIRSALGTTKVRRTSQALLK